MNTIFVNSENNKTPEPYTLLVNHLDKINLKRSDKYVDLSNLSLYYTWKSTKESYYKNKFKISAPAWKVGDFELPDGSSSISDLQDYFKYIIKKHKTVADKLIKCELSRKQDWM